MLVRICERRSTSSNREATINGPTTKQPGPGQAQSRYPLSVSRSRQFTNILTLRAALNGTVAGAGAVIAAASDIRIAGESAKIAFLFSRVGLTGADMGAAWLLPRIVGLAHASELLLLGDFITAERAAQIGLYNRVVAGERLMVEATDVAARLARGPSVALGVTKQALNEEAAMDLVSAIEWEAQAQAECMRNPNFREAYEAFRAKREPRFE